MRHDDRQTTRSKCVKNRTRFVYCSVVPCVVHFVTRHDLALCFFADEDWPTRSRASHLHPTPGCPDSESTSIGPWSCRRPDEQHRRLEHCRCPGRKHRPTVIRWIGKAGRRKTRGVSTVLAESAAYPRRMGQRIYACHTGQYIAQRPAAKSQRQQKTTTGKQPRASSARIAKTWLQPRASIHLLRPASSSPPSARATSVPKSRDWLHPGTDASSTKSSNVTRLLSQPSATGR